MKKILFLFIFFLAVKISFSQTVDWRFGFEYDETDPGFFGITEDTHDSIMIRLGEVTQSQSVRGGINVNSIGGGWETMQTSETDSIHFAQADGWVQRMQRNNFEIVWNLEPNAKWAFTNNNDCIHVTDINECAPDSAHWQYWYHYVRSIVERYDGDGDSDMVGLTKPVRFYVMEQEVYFGGFTPLGDSGESIGKGYWEDNMRNLIKLHEVTYQAIHDADSSGNTKLIGSGALLFDLYSDFPDYPNVDDSIVQTRINGNNISSATYHFGWDSLQYLLTQLGIDTPMKKCDYIGWHPHNGWQATDQCFRLIKTFAPNKPIFVDDMWSNLLTTIFPNGGFTQFIGGDSLNGDFPNSTVASFTALLNGLNNGNAAITNWYNAKAAREAVKCFTVTFGGGAERAEFSLSNDFNPNHIAYFLSYPFRYTGIIGNVPNGLPRKPVFYTMQLLVDKLHDFISVTQLNVSSNPYTRVYKFERQRGTACYVAWSETGWNPVDPQIANGQTVSFNVISDTLVLTNIVTQPGVTTPVVSNIFSSAGSISMQLGFEPVIIEEMDISTAAKDFSADEIPFLIYPNPSGNKTLISIEKKNAVVENLFVKNFLGQIVLSFNASSFRKNISGNQQMSINLSQLNAGIYFVELKMNGRSFVSKLLKK